jgi:integrase
MGRIVLRGTRDKRRVYADYYDYDGTRRTRLLKGVRTNAEGRGLLAQIELRVRAGRSGLGDEEMQPGTESPAAQKTMGPLMATWMTSLSNRNAKNDRKRAEVQVIPAWRDVTLGDGQTVAAVMRWLEVLKGGVGSGQSQRHAFNLLSRFWSWAIGLGHAEVNPCRSVPRGPRPHPAPDRDRPWIRDERTFQKLFAALPEPVNYVLWLGNRSGLRPSETRALRMHDFAFLVEGLIVVRGSAAHDGIGPLKEDWRGHGKAKMVPAHADTKKVIGPWLQRRTAEGAGPEDLVFLPTKPGDRPRASGWQGIRKEFVQSCWEAARIAGEVPVVRMA